MAKEDNRFIEKDGKRYIQEGSTFCIFRYKAKHLRKRNISKGFFGIDCLIKFRKMGKRPIRWLKLNVATRFDDPYSERLSAILSLSDLKKIVKLCEEWQPVRASRSDRKDNLIVNHPDIWATYALNRKSHKRDVIDILRESEA